MGSSISILNNTPFELDCIVTPDEAALKISGIVFTAVAAVAAIGLSGGILAPTVLPAAAGFGAAVTGLSAAMVKAIVVATVTAGGSQGVKAILDAIVQEEVKYLRSQGFQRLRPGERFTWGGKTLSLWQQGNCKRSRTGVGGMVILNDEVFMRPIFSGATDKSDRTHDVQFWVTKWFGDGENWENLYKVIVDPPDGRQSWGNIELSYAEWEKEFFTQAPTGVPTSATPTSATPTGVPTSTALTGVPTPVVTASPSNTPATSKPTFTPTLAVTMAPTATLTMAPTFLVPFECNVCTYSLTGSVTYPDVIVPIPGYGEFTCAEIETAGKNGLISEVNCPLVIQYLRPCGCYLPDQQCWGPLVQEDTAEPTSAEPTSLPTPSTKSGKKSGPLKSKTSK